MFDVSKVLISCPGPSMGIHSLIFGYNHEDHLPLYKNISSIMISDINVIGSTMIFGILMGLLESTID